MTWAACASYCTGYQYAGIKAGSTCRCGNSFALSPNLNADILCQTPCTGNGLQSCGASNRSTVFRSSSYGSTPSVSSAEPVLSWLAVSPPSSTLTRILPTLALTTSSATRAPASSILASTLPLFAIAQVPSVNQVVPAAATSVSSGAALSLVPASSIPPAVPILALTMIGEPLAFLPSSSTSSAVPLPPSTLVGAALGITVPGSLATTSGQPLAATLVGPALAFTATALLDPILKQTSTTRPLVPSLAPVLSLLAPVSSTTTSVQTSASVAIVLPSQSAIVPPQVQIPQPILPFVPSLVLQSPTAAGVAPLNVPVIASSTSIQLAATSQTLSTPLVPLAPLLSALFPPIPTLIQTPPVLVVPTLPLIPSSPVPLVTLPTSLVPILPTTLATLVSSSSLGVLPVATPVNEPFQIFNFLGDAAAAPPVGIPSLAAILPPVKPAPVGLSQPSLALPPGLLPTPVPPLPSLVATTANAPALELPSLDSPIEAGTPWWVVTQFLEPHGLPGPTILAPPPPLPTLQPSPFIVEPQNAFGAFSFDEPTTQSTVPAIVDEPQNAFDAFSFDEPTVPDVASNLDAIPSQTTAPAIVDEPQNAFGAFSFDEPTVPDAASNLDAIPSQTTAPAIVDEPQNAFGAFSFDEPTVPDAASNLDAIPSQTTAPAIVDEPQNAFGAFSFDEPPVSGVVSDANPAPIDFTASAIIESGTVVDKVFFWTFYSTGLVQVDGNFLSPFTGPLQGLLPDGTRIGLDSAGLYIGSEHRVPYPAEYSSIIAGQALPSPQLFL
ncbi:uncharacterized protein EKO05_0003218 [Ascochyta rabiei]|uniref:uncharacterized protein n=1 Tax=Didymella rabiei TaxID=5454 RepID=UPI00220E8BCC|nr:uncharacterized protein EKO05_0003218 [Ascochyta rabiei]UPX12678.1 hypothetical protein EKO05_0003218 [Ascochyta rabiei]